MTNHRPLRTISIAEQKRQARSRSNGGKAAKARAESPVAYDSADGIRRFKAILDEVYGPEWRAQ